MLRGLKERRSVVKWLCDTNRTIRCFLKFFLCERHAANELFVIAFRRTLPGLWLVICGNSANHSSPVYTRIHLSSCHVAYRFSNVIDFATYRNLRCLFGHRVVIGCYLIGYVFSISVYQFLFPGECREIPQYAIR